MGVDVAEGDQREPQDGVDQWPRPPAGPAPRSVRLQGVVLLDTASSEPVAIEALLFADDGIGVIRDRGERPRVLPWASLSAHAVEKWAGGQVPAHWLRVEPEGVRPEPWAGLTAAPVAPVRPLPRVDGGALIGIQTPFGTYRFLCPGGDPAELSRRVTEFAVRHQGPAAASSVTTVVSRGQEAQHRRSRRRRPKRDPWSRVKPYLVVTLVVVVGVLVTLILLQSAGAIHLPLLGGSGSGAGALRGEAP